MQTARQIDSEERATILEHAERLSNADGPIHGEKDDAEVARSVEIMNSALGD